MPALSVIIPTHKRADILTTCLKHLDAQNIVQDIEVIVIGDGHDQKTNDAMNKWKGDFTLKFFEIEKSHQGAARIKGVKEATADHCLFIGDDIFLFPDACERHVKVHKKFGVQKLTFPVAVLGHTTWDPSMDITPVMKWLERSGWQFGYKQLHHYEQRLVPTKIQHLYMYSSHLSLPTHIAREHSFRDDVSLYGWEDIEWGLRLKNTGVRLFYEPDAKAYHHHHMTLDQSLIRMETLGKSLAYLTNLVPHFDRLPRGWKKLAYQISAMFPTMAGKHREALLRGIDAAESVATDI